MNRLIIFSRYPEPGTTKTRLIAALGPDGASDLQRRMTERTVNCARGLRGYLELTLEVRFAGGDRSLMERWLGTDVVFRPQTGGDIGERMHLAFREAFEEGATRVVLVGSDIPGLCVETLHNAYLDLERSDVVIGPAVDGGYYLIGLREPRAFLFSGISWGSDQVLPQTLMVARRWGLGVELLGVLRDLDRVEDLPSLEPSLE